MVCSLLTHAVMDKTVIDKNNSNAEQPIIREECVISNTIKLLTVPLKNHTHKHTHTRRQTHLI